MICSGRVGGEIQDVPCTSADDGEGQAAAHCSAESFDHMEDCTAFSCAKVPGADAGVVIAQMLERNEVTLGEVEDVDIVADSGTVRGSVI